MDPVYLFTLTSRQASWLSVRQATVAENVANADTPGFAAKDVEPFRDVFDKTQLTMAATSSGHMMPAGVGNGKAEVDKGESWQVSVSKNSVSLEQEMIKAGQINRAHNLNTSITSKFHGFMLTSLGKG
ncbi:flagellar basal body rod protein FlgB [Polycladidibacter hongkongensis]|uniref:flagellar basal body rod protein FlgB n=1 Tax=Polycladidibacter hongkongensis TaxID=1647556 RepID=UPI000A4A6ADC|nr:flagellar basal body rod protein FlgB [Pseudovibrio hongkongensis]